MLQTTAPSSNTGVLDGLKFWIELCLLLAAGFSGFLGYKVNQIISKKGGIGDRMDESEKEIVRLQERSSNNARRIGDLERWKEWRERS